MLHVCVCCEVGGDGEAGWVYTLMQYNSVSPLQFKEISHAYEVLADEKRRQLYDEGGEEALKEGGLGGHSSPMDIFDMFFGGGRRRRDDRERRGRDTVHSLRVSSWHVEYCVCSPLTFSLVNVTRSHCGTSTRERHQRWH